MNLDGKSTIIKFQMLKGINEFLESLRRLLVGARTSYRPPSLNPVVYAIYWAVVVERV